MRVRVDGVVSCAEFLRCLHTRTLGWLSVRLLCACRHPPPRQLSTLPSTAVQTVIKMLLHKMLVEHVPLYTRNVCSFARKVAADANCGSTHFGTGECSFGEDWAAAFRAVSGGCACDGVTAGLWLGLAGETLVSSVTRSVTYRPPPFTLSAPPGAAHHEPPAQLQRGARLFLQPHQRRCLLRAPERRPQNVPAA